MAIEIVDFPIKHGGSFHGKMLVHQRVVFEMLKVQKATFCEISSEDDLTWFNYYNSDFP